MEIVGLLTAVWRTGQIVRWRSDRACAANDGRSASSKISLELGRGVCHKRAIGWIEGLTVRPRQR